MRDHLVIPDPHATPAEPNDRFDWLAQFILLRKPQVIVCLGDFACMQSLSSYDKNKRAFEGRQIKKDIDSAIDAQRRIRAPVLAYNRQRRRNKERQYKPKWVMLLGNHDEGRIEKALDSSPELEGLISVEHLQYQEFGWEIVPYRTSIVIDGVIYSHHFASGVMGQPISGPQHGRYLLQKNHMSSTVGHSHLLNLYHDVDANGNWMFGLSAGCFFENVAEWQKDTAKFYWRGLVYKHGVENGNYDPEFISLERLKRLCA